ncbi:unnamed protein product [Ectocarpus sp. CCAP 1310/34]|nr:unnamed protein product [Ectocarpus sp. CCAP 1310/34]
MLESQTMLDLYLLARENDVDVDRCKAYVIRILLGSGKELEPPRDATTDCAALLALFTAANGPSWKTSTAWGDVCPLGEWYGVTVDDDGRVSQLNTYKNGLSGAFPPELARLTALTKLNLGGNNLTGLIPSALGRLTGLEKLRLDPNELNGSIPFSLGGLTALQELWLYQNGLSGPIPSALGGLTALQKLILSNNQLSGPIPSVCSGRTDGSAGAGAEQYSTERRHSARAGQADGANVAKSPQQQSYRLHSTGASTTEGTEGWFYGNNFSGTKADVQQLLPDNCLVEQASFKCLRISPDVSCG